MTHRELNRKIIIRKLILNFLLNFLSPTRKLIVNLSQDLDNLVVLKQKAIYLRYRKKSSNLYSQNKSSKLNKSKKIA